MKSILASIARGICLLYLLATLALSVRAGGGPTGVVVLYNPDDPNSVTVANHYQRVRGIPERNMIPVSFPYGYNNTTIWDLVGMLKSELNQRGLTNQMQAIALAGYVPLQGASAQNRFVFSLASALYLAPHYDKDHPITGENAAYRIPPDKPTIALNGYTPVEDKLYWPVSYVGPTDHAALSARAAMATIDSARAADGSKPDGVIYWPLNTDIRSTTREWEIAQVHALWEKLGIKYSVSNGVWVKNRGDIAGGVVGIAVLDAAQGNRYLPGAWVDHLTSCGGVLLFDYQMPCSDFLLTGAGGSAGTMSEPYAIAGKFPNAHIHTHLRAGASLAEAFWQSIQMPFEILSVGDPIMQPYASFPKVTITAPKAGAVVKRIVAIQGSASGTVKLAPDRDLFVDGRRINVGDPAEPVRVTRKPTEFMLDTTSLTDGWHELRLVAYNSDAVHTQGEAIVVVTVNNRGQSVKVAGPATVDYTGDNPFTATGQNLPEAEISLRANGRLLGTAKDGTVVVPGNRFPFIGTCTVFAVAKLPDGSEIWSQPLPVSVKWASQPAIAAPMLGDGAARVRFFADTKAPGFSWDSVASAEGVVANAQMPRKQLVVSPATPLPGIVDDWTKVDFDKRPAIEISTWLYLVTGDIYEFECSAGDISLDGTALKREKNGLYGPVNLQAGWHALRTRGTLGDKNTQMLLSLRGGPLGKLTEINTDWCTAPAAEGAPQAPKVAITRVGETVVAPGKVIPSVAGTKVALTASSPNSDKLTYTWMAVKAPAIGKALRPDEPADVTFEGNSTTAAATTTATFTAAGNYILRVRAGNGQSAAVADIPITVKAVASMVTITAATAAQVAQGYPLDLYAAVVDQFGRRLETQPAITLGSIPTGKIEPLSAETFRFRPGTDLGVYQVSATAGGCSGKIAINVTTNAPPKLVDPITYMRAGRDGSYMLSTRVDDPEDTKKLYLTYDWKVEKQPAGQTLEITNQQGERVNVKPSGAGQYAIRFTARDNGGATVTDVLNLTFAPRADGTLILPPVASLVDASSLVTQRVFISPRGYIEGSTFEWQMSTDNGNTWAPLPEVTTQALNLGPLTGEDNGRQFRLKLTNEAGTCITNAAKLTVRDPSGGLITFDDQQVRVAQEADTATVVVHRRVHAKGKVSVDFTVQDSKYPNERWAKNGVHYKAVNDTLTWEDGDDADKTIVVPLLHNDPKKGQKLINVMLLNPKGDIAILREQTNIEIMAAPTPNN